MNIENNLQMWNEYISGVYMLRANNLIRTYRNPVNDFAEVLASQILNGTLADQVNQNGYDVATKTQKIQVKSIAKAPGNNNGYMIASKDRNNVVATHYAFVIFQNLVPSSIYIVKANFIKHFNKTQIKEDDLQRICILHEIAHNIHVLCQN